MAANDHPNAGAFLVLVNVTTYEREAIRGAGVTASNPHPGIDVLPGLVDGTTLEREGFGVPA